MDQLYVTNPYDSSPVGEIRLSSEKDLETALATAEKTHLSNRKGLPRHERIAILKKAAEILAGHARITTYIIGKVLLPRWRVSRLRCWQGTHKQHSV